MRGSAAEWSAPEGVDAVTAGSVWLSAAQQVAPELLPGAFGDYEPFQFRYRLDGPVRFLEQLAVTSRRSHLFFLRPAGVAASVDEATSIAWDDESRVHLRLDLAARAAGAPRFSEAVARFDRALVEGLDQAGRGRVPDRCDLVEAWQRDRSRTDRDDPTSWGASPTAAQLLDRLISDRLATRVVEAAVDAGEQGDVALGEALSVVGGERAFDVVAALGRTRGDHGTAALRGALRDGARDARGRRRVPAYTVLRALALRLGAGATSELVRSLDDPSLRDDGLWCLAAGTDGGAWEPVLVAVDRMLRRPGDRAVIAADPRDVATAGMDTPEMAGLAYLMTHAVGVEQRRRVLELVREHAHRLDRRQRASLRACGVPAGRGTTPPEQFDTERALASVRRTFGPEAR